jgi:acetyl-CoA carboxylase biotin carboxylase subunit
MNGKKILIANRGEIAIRVAKTVRELGHIAIGLYTDFEPNALHLQYCDQWIKLEGKNRQETFLNIEKIIGLCLEHKIDAVHPGYGFLSENTDFAAALEKEKIIFIGPNAKAIHSMGDKARAKQWARNAHVPVVPGSLGEVRTVEEALSIAKEIGYPILLKAVAGGGGKGMRPCYNDEELKHSFEIVRREAASSFNYAELLVEKLIEHPHHIEVQVLGDKKGNCFYFFERECSIQRRQQKIIEEAPSPFVGADHLLRKELCETAVRLAKAVGYDSAGTVEFIMGEDKKFYFLEMNTRIQVEHGITEEITGVDLVALMIQAALGEPLDIQSQEEITRQGHAIELRICLEDANTMLPAPGIIESIEMTFPQGIRLDHCMYEGLNITADFDPMVGKLIAKGHHREMAIRKLECALEHLLIEGAKTNVSLLQNILHHPQFQKGGYTTDFLKTYKEDVHVALEDEETLTWMLEKIAIFESVHRDEAL